MEVISSRTGRGREVKIMKLCVIYIYIYIQNLSFLLKLFAEIEYLKSCQLVMGYPEMMSSLWGGGRGVPNCDLKVTWGEGVTKSDVIKKMTFFCNRIFFRPKADKN